MNITERKKFYEKLYFYELDSRDKIYMKIRLPITILTFMASINFFLIAKVFVLGSELSIKLVMPSMFTILSVLILIYLLHCIYQALIGRTYHEVSFKDFEKYYNQLTEYYKKYYGKDYDEQKLALMADETFEKNLAQQLMEYADHNRNVNVERGGYLMRFIKILPFYSFVLILLYALLFIYT